MDAYTKELLALAVEAMGMDALVVAAAREPDWMAVVGMEGGQRFEAPTLSDALTALLTDLGVSVPKRPSAERVAVLDWVIGTDEWGDEIVRVAHLRDLYAREPLNVIRLLEGGEA